MTSYGSGATAKFASNPKALALCDRCGFRYRLNELHTEFYDLRPNGLKVCKTCLDKDHPQLQLGRVRVYDPIALYNPRPDQRQPSVTYFGWNPIGNYITGTIYCYVGDLTVSITPSI